MKFCYEVKSLEVVSPPYWLDAGERWNWGAPGECAVVCCSNALCLAWAGCAGSCANLLLDLQVRELGCEILKAVSYSDDQQRVKESEKY